MVNHEDDAFIDELYDLVASPEDYDAFLASLESKLRQLSSAKDERKTALATHLNRAVELLDVVTPWNSETSPHLREMLNNRVPATLSINWDGRIVDANDTANLVYNLPSEASVSDLPLESTDQATFLSDVRNTIRGRVTRNSPANVRRYFSAAQERSMLVKLEAFHVPETNEVLAVVKTSDIGWPSYLAPILRDLFDLTNAEIEVLRLVVSGARVTEIAERRLISVATVRSQLRAIFAKTNTSSQIECVRLVFGLSSMHENDEGMLYAAQLQRMEASPFYPRDDQRRILKLRDGRDLDYAVFGHPDGKPILYLHCEVTGETWFKEAVEHATKMGFKIITPLRPGYGRSSPLPEISNVPAICARDTRELLDTLDVDKVSIFAVCCGFTHSLATAHLLPDRVHAIKVTRPYFPVESLDELDGFTGYTQWVQNVRFRFPQGLRFVVKAGFAFVSASGPVVFGRSLVRASPQDVAWVAQSDNVDWLQRGLSTFRYQGYLGTFGDLNYYGDWKRLLRTSPVPITALIGEFDRNVQWREAQKWSDELELFELRKLPNSGYMVHHQHSDQILKLIKSDFP